ncbi:MAG: oligosaccharide flippase family protein [Rhodobacteraceae bacterium]|nr:oligosaccharide flippase family protein [Paracoccaceae bacterium]
MAVAKPEFLQKQAVGPQKTMRETVSVFGIKMLGLLAGFISISVLAQMVQQADLGLYLLVFSLSGFFGICIQFGLGSVSLKRLAETVARGEGWKTGGIMAAALRILLVLFGIFAVFWVLGVNRLVLNGLFSLETTGFISVILLLWAGLFALQKLIAESLRGLHMIRAASIFDGAGSAVFLGIILLIFFGFSAEIWLETVLIIAVTVFGVTGLIGLLMLQKHTRFVGSGPVGVPFGVLVLAGPVFLTEMAVFVNNQADLWVVAAFLPAGDVANYGVVLRIAILVMLPSIVANAVIIPKIIQLNTLGNRDGLNRLLGVSAALAFGVTLAMVLGLFLFGKQALAVFFGPSYAVAFPVMMVLCIGRLINVFTGSCGQVLLFCGHAKKMMVSTVVFSAVSLLIALLLVKGFGPIGVAFGFALGMAGQNIVQYLLVRRLISVSTIADFSVLFERHAPARSIK